jgi:hypothetical protein
MAKRQKRSSRYGVLFAFFVILGISSILLFGGKTTREQVPHVHSTTAHLAEPARINTIASLELKRLIRSHPHEEIRGYLYRAIEEGTVWLNFQAELLIPGTISSTALIDISGKGLTPTLVLNPSELLDTRTSTRKKQLVIYHEYLHLRQLIEKRVPPETFLLRDKNKVMTFEEGKQLFHAELEAYLAECALATVIGAVSEIDLCVAYSRGLLEMKRVLARSLATTYNRFPEAVRGFYAAAEEP